METKKVNVDIQIPRLTSWFITAPEIVSTANQISILLLFHMCFLCRIKSCHGLLKKVGMTSYAINAFTDILSKKLLESHPFYFFLSVQSYSEEMKGCSHLQGC